MTEWRKNTGTEMPSELAAAQIVEWTTCRDVEVGHYQKSDRVPWFSGMVEYRPALAEDGLPYVSAEGLEMYTYYIAKEYDGAVVEFRYKPEYMSSIGEWDFGPEYNGHDPELLYTGNAPSTHAIPGDPANSLAKVWRE